MVPLCWPFHSWNKFTGCHNLHVLEAAEHIELRSCPQLTPAPPESEGQVHSQAHRALPEWSPPTWPFSSPQSSSLEL